MMAQLYELKDIKLLANSPEEAKQAKQAIINIIRDYNVDAEGVILMNNFATKNKGIIRSSIKDLKAGKGIGSIITKVLPKLLSNK